MLKFLCLLITSTFILERAKGLAIDQKLMENISQDVLSQIVSNGTDIYNAVLNDYGDKILNNLNSLLRNKGLDPYRLDDVKEEFQWGHLSLTDIEIDGLSTFYRSSDDVLMYNHQTKILQINLTLSLKDLKFGSEYDAKLLGLTQKGTITGILDEIETLTSISVDFNLYQAVVEEFSLNSGNITLKLNGNPSSDKYVNYIVNSATKIFKRLITEVVDSMIYSLLESAVEVIDGLLKLLLD